MAVGIVAVTGATGGIGGRVAERLAKRGLAQRLVVRDPARVTAVERAEVVKASYDDPVALRAAFTGATSLLFVSAQEQPDRLEAHRCVVDAAAAAGVSHIVYTSFLGAGPEATFTFARDHWHTEQYIRASGLPFTFLRDSIYLDFVPQFVGDDGVIRGPAGDGLVAPVARDDIADVAFLALTQAGHEGATYDLTGPRVESMADLAAILTGASGRVISYHPETMEEAFVSRARYGAPDWMVRGWVTTYAAIAVGELNLATDHIYQLTGNRPMDLGAYLARYPEVVVALRG